MPAGPIRQANLIKTIRPSLIIFFQYYILWIDIQIFLNHTSSGHFHLHVGVVSLENT